MTPQQRTAELAEIRRELADLKAQGVEPTISPLAAAGLGAIDGVSFGFADEIAGLAGPQHKDNLRRSYDRARQDRPVSFGAGQVGGGLATAFVPGVAIARGAQGAARLGAMAATGAAAGAASGIGAGEGGAFDGERYRGALPGAALGALAGPAIYGAGKALAPVGRGLSEALAKPPARVRAARIIDDRLIKDGIDAGNPNALEGARRRAGAKGVNPPETIAEIAQYGAPAQRGRLRTRTNQSNIGGLAEAASQTPGAAQTEAARVIAARNATRADRLSRAADDAVASQRGSAADYGSELAQIQQSRRAQAQPLYEQLHRVEIAGGGNTGVAGIIARLDEAVPGLLKEADAIGRLEGAPEAFGSGRLSGRSVDLLKRALDDRVSTLYRNGQGTLAGSLKQVREQLIDEFDGQTNGLYRQALSQYSGSKRLEEMLRTGRDVLKMDHWDIAGLLKGSGPRGALSADEVDAFRLGVSRAIQDALEQGDMRLVRSFLGKPRVQQQLAEAFGVAPGEAAELAAGKLPRNASPAAKRFAEFRNQIDRESAMQDFGGRLLGGSQTARRQEAIRAATEGADDTIGRALDAAADSSVVPRTFTGVLDAAAGAAFRRGAGVIRDAYRRRTQPGIYDPEVNAELGQFLFAPARKQNVDNLAQAIAEARRRAPAYLSPAQKERWARAAVMSAAGQAGRGGGDDR